MTIGASRSTLLRDDANLVNLRERLAIDQPRTSTGFDVAVHVQKDEPYWGGPLILAPVSNILLRVRSITLGSGASAIFELYADTSTGLFDPVLVAGGFAITAAGQYKIPVDVGAVMAVAMARDSERVCLASKVTISGTVELFYEAQIIGAASE